MCSMLLFVTLLALTGVTLSSPYGREVNLLEDVVSSIQQDEDDGDDNLLEDVVSSIQQDEDGDDGEGRADIEALDALINAFSSVQQDGEGGDEGGDEGGNEEDNANTQGLISKIRKFVRTLKVVGTLAHQNFPRNKYVRKYSKYLRCLPNVQEELERVTTQEDAEKEFKELLSSLEDQARSEEDTAKVQFFRRLWRKARRFGKRVFKGIRIVKKYLKCIRRSVQVQSTEEMNEVKEQAMDVLQRAVTAGLVRL